MISKVDAVKTALRKIGWSRIPETSEGLDEATLVYEGSTMDHVPDNLYNRVDPEFIEDCFIVWARPFPDYPPAVGGPGAIVWISRKTGEVVRYESCRSE